MGFGTHHRLGDGTRPEVPGTNRRLNANVCAVINTHNTRIMLMPMS